MAGLDPPFQQLFPDAKGDYSVDALSAKSVARKSKAGAKEAADSYPYSSQDRVVSAKAESPVVAGVDVLEKTSPHPTAAWVTPFSTDTAALKVGEAPSAAGVPQPLWVFPDTLEDLRKTAPNTPAERLDDQAQRSQKTQSRAAVVWAVLSRVWNEASAKALDHLDRGFRRFVLPVARTLGRWIDKTYASVVKPLLTAGERAVRWALDAGSDLLQKASNSVVSLLSKWLE